MAIHFKKFKSGKIWLNSIFTRILWIILLFFMFTGIKTFPQTNLCENLVFEKGSSVLTKKMKDQLNQLCKKTLSTKRGRIALTVWQNDDTESIHNTGLAEKRMRTMFAYLIANNCGPLVSEIRIKPLQTDSLMETNTPQPDNKIEFCILEAFPDESENDIILEKVNKMLPGLLVREPDTIIRGANGTLIKFSFESFKPYKFYDFRYEIDEVFTTEALSNHNMSTMTSGGALITSFKALRIWATPVNPEIPLPVTLAVRATVLIPVDSSMRNVITDNMLVFRPGKGNKPFITWNKSADKPHIEMYGGRNYFLVQTDVMGCLAIGRLNQTRKTFFVKIPRFTKLKITVKSDSDHFLAIFNEPNQRMIRLMSGDTHSGRVKDFFITAEGIDGWGNLYVLKQTAFDRFSSKKKKNYFVIRKKDFQKL